MVIVETRVSWRASCYGKHKHLSAGDARERIQSLADSGNLRGQLTDYLCGFCRAYHIGHVLQ